MASPLVPNKNGKAPVWKYYGFPKEPDGNVDKSRVGCIVCKSFFKYSGNTTNLIDHISRKHPELIKVIKDPSSPVPAPTQNSIVGMFQAKMPPSKTKSEAITAAITRFIVKDLRPYCVVENPGFRNLITVLQSGYKMPSRQHLSEKVVPELYEKVKQDVKGKLKGEAVSLTTDGWTSRATESYVTVTSTHIDTDWKLQNFVLQTREMPESHTGSNIARVLTEAVEEWGLQPNPPVVSDNASNMVAAMRLFETSLHVGCFAHTLNLACGKALKIASVSKLLARMRRIVTYFHRSAVAAAVLKEKQLMLKLPKQKLVIDVVTRWNSSLDMMVAFLQQQPAVYSALTDKEIRGKEKDISTLSETDIAAAEDLVLVLTPLKTATKALCDEKVPTLSLVMPLLHHLTNVSMAVKDDDSSLVRDVKQAVAHDLSSRYLNVKKQLTIASLLDPRFKAAPFLSAEESLTAYQSLTLEAVSMSENSKPPAVTVKIEKADSDVPSVTEQTNPPLPKLQEEEVNAVIIEDVSVEEPQPPKRLKSESIPSAMSSLFGDVYITRVDNPKTDLELCETQVSLFKKEPPIATSNNPLDWWKANSHKYPSLVPVAKKYLGIPATSVPSERVFSTAGDIVTAQRSALSPEHVDRLIFLKKNWNPK